MSAPFTLLLALAVPTAPQAALNCGIGPAPHSFGGSDWMVYACDDGHSLTVLTAPGNPATPYRFVLSPSGTGYQIYGQGQGGDQAGVTAAYQALYEMAPEQIEALNRSARDAATQ